mmetsp:Transcript_17172/g.43235  ORF Transcript_17172/g.43235 Transcript_17172/m.43235 type:complete len:255 (-) Transcript_17172:333-1097(-)
MPCRVGAQRGLQRQEKAIVDWSTPSGPTNCSDASNCIRKAHCPLKSLQRAHRVPIYQAQPRRPDEITAGGTIRALANFAPLVGAESFMQGSCLRPHIVPHSDEGGVRRAGGRIHRRRRRRERDAVAQHVHHHNTIPVNVQHFPWPDFFVHLGVDGIEARRVQYQTAPSGFVRRCAIDAIGQGRARAQRKAGVEFEAVQGEVLQIWIGSCRQDSSIALDGVQAASRLRRSSPRTRPHTQALDRFGRGQDGGAPRQ